MVTSDNQLISIDSKIRVHDRTFIPYIDKQEIVELVERVAKGINHSYSGREITLLVILKGSMVFAADLMRRLTIPCTVETLRATSYTVSMVSSGLVSVEETFPDLQNKHVVVVEDIVDTGGTISELIKHISACFPASITVAALLSKPDQHAESVTIDYVGREIPAKFVVGYGMDYAGYGRELDSIWVLDDTE